MKPLAGFAPPPRSIAQGLWVVDRQLTSRIGVALPARMTIAQLPAGGLWLHSPVTLDEETRSAVDALGPVEAIVAPNAFHYLFVEDAMRAYPEASLFLAPGLWERRPELPMGAPLGDGAPASWASAFEQLVFGPVKGFSEVVFLHRQSGTLILTDLCFSMRTIERRLDRWLWRLAGVPASFGPSRLVRLTLLRDRQVAARFAAQILTWQFDRIVVNHGEVCESGGTEIFRRAFARFTDA